LEQERKLGIDLLSGSPNGREGRRWNEAQETVKKANHEMHDEHNILQIPVALGVH